MVKLVLLVSALVATTCMALAGLITRRSDRNRPKCIVYNWPIPEKANNNTNEYTSEKQVGSVAV